MTNRKRAAAWLDAKPARDLTIIDTLTALLDTIDVEATKRSADVVRDLAENLHESMDPGLAAVVRKALSHAAKKIEQAAR